MWRGMKLILRSRARCIHGESVKAVEVDLVIEVYPNVKVMKRLTDTHSSRQNSLLGRAYAF
jgi:hypothetical protein